MVGLGLLAAAAVLLTLGADLFTAHATEMGRQLGVSPVAIGVLFAGAEPEELVTAIAAAAAGRAGIASGDAVGANLTMLTLVLGLALLTGAVTFDASLRAYSSRPPTASTRMSRPLHERCSGGSPRSWWDAAPTS